MIYVSFRELAENSRFEIFLINIFEVKAEVKSAVVYPAGHCGVEEFFLNIKFRLNPQTAKDIRLCRRKTYTSDLTSDETISRNPTGQTSPQKKINKPIKIKEKSSSLIIFKLPKYTSRSTLQQLDNELVESE